MCIDFCAFFFQAEDGIRDLVRSRGLGDVYKRQAVTGALGHLLLDQHREPLLERAVSQIRRAALVLQLSLIHI